MLNYPRNPARSQMQGFALVEAMVTVLVFAIGLLGVIGLQTIALSSTSTSSMRTEATVLAYDLADRMRANNVAARGVAGVGYDGPAAAVNSCRRVYSDAIEAAPAACDANDLAADDLYDWQQQVAQSLPGGLGTVCIDSTPDDGNPGAPACDGVGVAYAIKVWWSQRATEDVDAAVVRHAMVVRP